MAAGAAAWTLVNQMNPSADVQALASIQVDVSGVAEGTQLTVKWLGKPVFIRRRTPAEIEAMRPAGRLVRDVLAAPVAAVASVPGGGAWCALLPLWMVAAGSWSASAAVLALCAPRLVSAATFSASRSKTVS